jgi:diaphanous 1
MYQMPLERKRYLLQQNRQFGSVSKATISKSFKKNSQPTTYSPASGGNPPRLVPQVTGDSFIKRFSVVGWGAGSSISSSPKDDDDQAFPSGAGKMMVGGRRRSVEQPEPQPLQPQSTGGLWSSLWPSSSGNGDKAQKETPRWYVERIRNGKTADMKLIKHLIALRVHLSTANLAWVEEFVQEEMGIESLGATLATLVGKGGKRKTLTEVENSTLFEIVKCFRVLLNTEVGAFVCRCSRMLTFHSLDLIKSCFHPP